MRRSLKAKIVSAIAVVVLLGLLFYVYLRMRKTQEVFGDIDPPPGYSGTWRKLRQDGSLYRKEHYANGKLHGKVTVLHRNGRKEHIWHYADGKRVGVSRGWYPDGNPSNECHWIDDKLHGPIVHWSGGVKTLEGNYEDGKRQGDWKEWYSKTGARKCDGQYAGDRRVGRWREWERDGSVAVSGTYKNGRKWDGRFRHVMIAKTFGWAGTAVFKDGKPWSGNVLRGGGGMDDWHIDTYAGGVLVSSRTLREEMEERQAQEARNVQRTRPRAPQGLPQGR